MAGLEVGNSSISVIFGPPGTGKTHIIKLLIGALLHNSVVSHFREGATYSTIQIEDTAPILHFRDNPDGVRILITFSGNGAVDQVGEKPLQGIYKLSLDIMENGIPAPSGGIFVPMMVLVGGYNLKYCNLELMSARVLGIKYDNAVLHPREERHHLSDKSLQAITPEAIIIFSKTSSAAS